MADMHITRELLEAITRGEIPVRVLEDLVLEHLRRVCPHCRREMEEFAREQEGERKLPQRFRHCPPAVSALPPAFGRFRKIRMLRSRHDL